MLTTTGGASFTVVLPDEQATMRLMVDVASALEPGDVLTLSGDLGAGKTTFARAMIRYLAGDETIEVPSPTFTLMQTYELPRFPVVHADFYRVTGSAELAELGFDDLPEGAVVVVEWPDRAAGFLPADRIDLTLTLAPKLKPEFRHARVTGYGSCAPRVDRIATVRQFIAEAGLSEATRVRMAGDASTRRYHRLILGNRRAILMDAPRRPDGPPVKNGKPYSQIAHLAESVVPFVAMAKGLRAQELTAPEIQHADMQQGLLVIEDLGSEGVVSGDPPAPIVERYETAVDVLVALHAKSLPAVLPVAPHVEHEIPSYDMDAMLIEVELLLEWYLPRLGIVVTDDARADFFGCWRDALDPVINAPPTWTLRDFHSPNLLWLPERKEIARIGLLDFQDAVMGPPAYDVASLLQDARVDVPEEVEVPLLGRYVRARRAADAEFDPGTFIRSYVTLAAQRASKILGIFARLDVRDGKPQYLRHMPRISGYLQRSLAHPSLEGLNEWYGRHVPGLSLNNFRAS
ncbi:MAG: tRNA (adenosine(37)-N6)-threonylcarbamoyltransferase complex ATPase subunit type 1 TsaE [Xanthobacteraceae bacterium]|nr:tRNA (adenosine(37)-N6)-threonylcarbamoyltransferase complex ATPase subunit type 1 TsaE [Xanthobacteraceae bacterium]